MRYLVIGGGCVGLSLCAVLMKKGHAAVLCERDAERRRAVVGGRLPFHEPALEKALSGAKGGGLTIVPAADKNVCMAVDGVFVCVGTPAGSDGRPDATGVFETVLSLPPLKRHAFIAVRSTVPVGACDALATVLWRRRVANRLAYMPEFLREGLAYEDAVNPSRTVIGGAAAELLRLWPDAITMTLKEAELVKLASNAYLAVRVAFFGELFDAARDAGASYLRIAGAMGRDSRIGGAYMDAAAGFGGPCLEKDATALSKSMTTVKAALDANARKKRAATELLHRYYRQLEGMQIAVLGTAFKQGTSDTRNSAGMLATETLEAEGATVRTWDKLAKCNCNTPEEAVRGAAAALIFTRDVDKIDVKSMAEPLIIDVAGALDGRETERAGGVYERLGCAVRAKA